MYMVNIREDWTRWSATSCCLSIGLYLIPWWRHQMEAFSALLALRALLALCILLALCELLALCRELPSQRPVTWSFVFSLICIWTNGWVNNGDAGGLRRNRAHYGVTVMRKHNTMTSRKWHGVSNNRQLSCLLNSLLWLNLCIVWHAKAGTLFFCFQV